MAKGIKRIKQVAGHYYTASSKGNLVVLKADENCSFAVAEWLPDTKDSDKSNLVWLLEDVNRTEILLEHRGAILNKIMIPRDKCGSKPWFYLDASLSNKIDKTARTGLLIQGKCDPLIKEAIWSAAKDGPRLGQTALRYGDQVYLKITTEGLNGNNLFIEIYQRRVGKNLPVRNINAECVNGVVNLSITNTYSWYAALKDGPEKAELFIMVKDMVSGQYVKDNRGDDFHARFLRMENKVVSKTVSPPTNITVAKVGEKVPQPGREDLCRFTKIEITDGADRVIIFDEGKIKKGGKTNKPFYIDEKVFYDFNKHNLKPEAKAILNKMAKILMEMPYIPVELGSHTDRFGSDSFNMELSEKRAKATVDYLVSQNVNISRIISKGYGKTMLANNNPNLSKEESYVNRRTTIKLRIFAHDAQSLVFETIQPGKTYQKQLPIKITDFHTKGLCNFVSDQHIEQVPYSVTTPSNKKDVLALEGDTIKPYVYSPMDNTISGFDYLFPHLRSPNSFFFYINSCRYFSDKQKPSLIVKAYSDIKWDFKFFLNLSNPLELTWQGPAQMSPGRIDELRAAAKKLGDADYNKTTGIDFGVKLSSSWNKQGDIYRGKEEYTLKFKKEIKTLYSLISSVKEISRGIISNTGGAPRKTGFGTSTSLIVKVLAPKFVVGLEWKLARGSKKNVATSEIGTEYKIYFHSEPLIGLELTVDLLNLVLKGASMAATGNTVAADVFIMVKDWASKGYKSEKAEISFDMYIDLVLTGTIAGGVKDIIINTASDRLQVDGELKSQITATLQAGVTLKAKLVLIEAESSKTDVHATASLSASATIGITATHNFSYDTNKGLFYRPGLVMDPCIGKVVLLVDVGISYRKISADWRPINYQENRTFWEEFNIMKSLEQLTGISPNMTIISRSND